MVQQLTKPERIAHRWEFPTTPTDPGGFRIRVALDRENQTHPDARERAVRYLAVEAVTRAFAEQERAHIETMAKEASV